MYSKTEKVCIICGEKFYPKNQLAQICYKDHYRICKYCGNKFLIKKIRYINRDYCFNKGCSDKARIEKSKESCMSKYGVDHHMKVKENVDKSLNTNRLNHNGVLAWNTDKQKQTMIKKYNVDNPGKSKESREKAKLTCLERYGSKTYNNSKKNLETFRKNHLITIKIKKGNKIIKRSLSSGANLQLTEFQRNILLNKENFKEFIDERYEKWHCASKIYKELKIEHSTFFRYLDKYDLRKEYKFRSNISWPEIELREFFEDKFPKLKIYPNYRKWVKQYGEIDIYIPSLKLGIEFNGLRWHDKEKYLKDLSNNTCYSREKLKEENFRKFLGIEIYQIWGDEFATKIQKENKLNELESLINEHFNKLS